MPAARRLEKMLRRSAATVTLHIEVLRADQQRQLERLLKRLAPYGDRVSVWIDERVRPLVPIDSSVFHLLLARDPRNSIPSVYAPPVTPVRRIRRNPFISATPPSRCRTRRTRRL